MTIPAAFRDALARARVRVDLWIEIEGIPFALGLTSRTSAFFSGRTATERRTETLGVLVEPPRGVEQRVSPLEGSSSIGELTAVLLLDAAGKVRSLVGGSHRTDNWLYLDVDLTDTGTETSIDYTGTADPTLYPAGGGTFYCGRETFTYTSRTESAGAGTFSGVTRGCYAIPGRPAKDKHTAGDVISPYARFLATRRLVLMATLDETDANRLARWGGTIRGAQLGRSLSTLEVTMQSIDGDLSVRAFATQRSAKLYAGLADGVGAYTPDSEGEPAFETTRLRLVTESLAGDWTDGDTMMVQVGDEVVAGTVGTEDGIRHLTLDTLEPRGLFDTPTGQHTPGETVTEVIWTGAYSATGGARDRYSKFTQGDGVLSVVLQFILSRRGDGANGPYDVLPPGWGIGIPEARVDVAGIERLQLEWLGGATHRWLYFEPFTLKAEIAAILRPFLCFPLSKLDDVLTVQRLSPPIPSYTLREIDADAIVGIPSWNANVLEVIGRVLFRCDFDAFSDEYRQVFIGEMQGAGLEAQEFYAGLYKTLEIDARGQFTGNDPEASFFGARENTGATSTAERYIETIRDRYARPFPIIGVECSYDYLDVEVGDLVRLTLDHVPNTGTGGDGLDGAICEVFGKTINDLTGRVTLSLAHTATFPRYRLVGPSGIVGSVLGAAITLTDGVFNSSGGNRTDGFAVGDVVRVLSSDLTTVRGTATIASLSASALTVDAAPAGTTAGDVVMLAAYTSQPAATKARCAFLADSSNLLGGVDAGHVFAG